MTDQNTHTTRAAADYYHLNALGVAAVVAREGAEYFSNPVGVLPVAWLPDRVMTAQPFS